MLVESSLFKENFKSRNERGWLRPSRRNASRKCGLVKQSQKMLHLEKQSESLSFTIVDKVSRCKHEHEHDKINYVKGISLAVI